jgi:CTP:molybdopterin cytidylyltransferase MocA
MKDNTKTATCGMLLLAAGESARLGKPKQLLPFKGSTLLRHAAEVALSVHAETTVVVLGAYASRMREEIMGMQVDVVMNEHYEQGMASSITRGLHAMLNSHPQLEGVLIMVCDQPYVNTVHLRTLIERQKVSGAAVVASFYKGRKGVPAFFHQDIFPELLALTGDVGARNIIEKYQEKTESVPFPLGDIDIDTPDRYETLMHQADQGNGIGT